MSNSPFPWSGISRNIPDNVRTMSEVIKSAQLDWEVGTKPLATVPEGWAVPNRAVYRKDNNVVLGVVGSRWNPLQNIEKFNFFDSFVESGLVKIESAMALNDGEKVCIIGSFNSSEVEIGKQDVLKKYFMICDSFDGSLAIKVLLTPLRMFCYNMLVSLLKSKASQAMSIRHSANLHVKLEEIKQVVNVANEEFDDLFAKFRFLLSKKVPNLQAFDEYAIEGLAFNKGEDGISTRAENQLRVIQDRYNEDSAIHGRNWWTAYNAVNGYLNHTRGNTEHSRIDSMFFGDSNRKNRNSFDLALKLANAA